VSISTYFSGAVDVLNGEDVSQAVQQHFSHSRNQLGGGDQHVHTLPPVHGDTEGYGYTLRGLNATCVSSGWNSAGKRLSPTSEY